MRYFFFSYVYSVSITSTQKVNGTGNFAISSLSFPSSQSLKKLAKDMVTEIGFYNAEVIITNWIEMTEEDYKSYNDEN